MSPQMAPITQCMERDPDTRFACSLPPGHAKQHEAWESRHDGHHQDASGDRWRNGRA